MVNIPVVVAFVIGAAVSGFAEEYVFHAADLAINGISNCSNIKSESWQGTCNQVKLYYYLGKGAISAVGGIVSILLFIKLIQRQ